MSQIVVLLIEELSQERSLRGLECGALRARVVGAEVESCSREHGVGAERFCRRLVGFGSLLEEEELDGQAYRVGCTRFDPVRCRSGCCRLAERRRFSGLRRRRQLRSDIHPRLHRAFQPGCRRSLAQWDVAAIRERDGDRSVWRQRHHDHTAPERDAGARPVLPRPGGQQRCSRFATAHAGHYRRLADRHERERGQGGTRQQRLGPRLQRIVDSLQRRAVGADHRPGGLWQRQLL